jgi:threonine/homoserine/homoserine lactone efflux protein
LGARLDAETRYVARVSAVNKVAGDLIELVPLAMVIAISPFSIIPAVLVLSTPRPRPTSLAFLAGWLLGLAALTAASVRATDAAAAGLDSKPTWAPYVRIIIGGALIAFAVYRWLGRHRSAHAPKWMTAMTSVGPGRAFVTGILLTVVNLKVLAMCAAAGAAIGTAALGEAGAWSAVLVFTALAASSVAVPVLAYLVAGDRLAEPLARVKEWMERNHAGLVAGILLFIGAALLYKGIHAL